VKFIYLILIFLFAVAGCQTMEPSTAKISSDILRREVLATDLSFDAQAGEIKYTLPEPALVRIWIGLKDGGPLLRTLLDWEPRSAGEHVEVWDGKDSTGLINFGNKNNLMLVLGALTLDSGKNSEILSSTTLRGFQKSPEFKIDFPESQKKSSEGVPMIRGISPVRITLSERDKEWLTRTKYEIGLYLDEVYLTEDEEGTSPFTYPLDTRNMNNGRHILTVNIVSFTGEIGTQTIYLIVNNQTRQEQ